VTRGVENERHRPLFMPYLSHMWRAPAGADSPVLAAFLRAKLNFSKLLGVREAPEACWPGYPREVNGHQARALSLMVCRSVPTYFTLLGACGG
jgi:hypothetical protein